MAMVTQKRFAVELDQPSTSVQHYHSMTAAEVAIALGVIPEAGLNQIEIEFRRRDFGPNIIQSIRQRSNWLVLLSQFKSIIVGLLIFAAVLAFLTGDSVEGMAIVVVLTLNAAIGFATEWQAGRALNSLRKQILITARVRRDQREITIPASELVVGDVIVLNAGDRVPADARIVKSSSLRVEESALTGESEDIEKNEAPVGPAVSLPDRKSMVYLGATIRSGRAEAIVVATGVKTELGRIGKLVAESPVEETPLERRLDSLGRRLVVIVIAIAIVVLIAGWLRGDGFVVMIEVSISLAVAAVPEGLPAVTTLILALGVLRMARQRAIVRRLNAVETLGVATVVCSDKTGTLTENRMTVREYHLADGRIIGLNNNLLPLAGDELLTDALLVSVLCNEASFDKDGDGKVSSLGDPTETALLESADRFGLDIQMVRALYPKTREQPFSPATKRMVTYHLTSDGVNIVALKGAPSVVLNQCSKYSGGNIKHLLTDETRQRLIAANESMAGRALRVLALAVKRSNQNSHKSAEHFIEPDFTFLGFVGMIDPPRPGVAEAIKSARMAGIRTVMITGDQINTARAIAKELRLSGDSEPRAIHASELKGATHRQIAELADRTDVFARVSPDDKFRIVEALQFAGEIVAVTGDGINDAPALKRADIGVAMGERGTEVAKEAADIVLADDNFATIIRAVESGRNIYDNIIKFVHMIFSHNLGEVIVIFTAIVIGWPLPLLPLQILWMNLVTDVFPALALAVEPTAPGIMQRPPRKQGAALFSPRLLTVIGVQGLMLAVIALTAYAWALACYGPGARSQTITLSVLVAVQLGHMFNCRSRIHSAFNGLFRNPYLWVAVGVVIFLQVLAVKLPELSRVLGTVDLSARDWTVVVFAFFAPVLIVEIAKGVARKWNRDNNHGQQ